MAPEIVVICGMHRSGTSMTAEMCGLLGYGYPDDLMEPNIWNARGYFESRSLTSLHDDLFRKLGSAWWDPRPYGPKWFDNPDFQNAWTDQLAGIEALVRSSGPLVLKDPRMNRFMPLWLDWFARAGIRYRLVFVLRGPSEVANSLWARDHLPPIAGGLLWWRYVTDLVRALKTAGAEAEILTYDRLLQDPEGGLVRLADWIGKDLKPRRARTDEVWQIVDSSLRRSGGSAPGLTDTELASCCEHLMSTLLVEGLSGIRVAEIGDPEPVLSGLAWWHQVAPLFRKHESMLKEIRSLSRFTGA